MSVVQSILPEPAYPVNDFGSALVIDQDADKATGFEQLLRSTGYEACLASDSEAALEWFRNNSVDVVFIAADYLEHVDVSIVTSLKNLVIDAFVPVVVTCDMEQEGRLDHYFESGIDDYLLQPATAFRLEKRLGMLKRLKDLHNMYRLSIHEQEVGKKIHTAAISTRILDVDPVKSVNRSAGVFSGDLILLARKPGGNIHIMLADFTGHGLSAAIGALPVADTFCVMTEKGFRPEVIIRQINRKLYTLLPTSMFMSMALIQISPRLDKVNIWNAGMPEIYLLDAGDGRIREKVASTSIPLGVVEHIEDQINATNLDINQGDTLIMHSDGLTECINERGDMFGSDRLESILNISADVDDVFAEVLNEFDRFFGAHALADDVSLVAVPCVPELFQQAEIDRKSSQHVNHVHNGSWKWSMELSGASMYDVDPVPMIIREYSKLLSQPVSVMDLHNVLTELYKNALEYGVFRNSRRAFEREHRTNRNETTNANLLDGCFIRIAVELIDIDTRPGIFLKVEDSGRGFDHDTVMQRVQQDSHDVSIGYGLSLASTLCDTLQFNAAGNCIEAVMIGE